MKASRTFIVWVPLILCALAVIAGMTWLTHRSLEHQQESLRAEQNHLYAELRADIEERTRLSLWRLDAFAAGILQSENRLPATNYLSARSADTIESSTLCRFEVTEPVNVQIGSAHNLTKSKYATLLKFASVLPSSPKPKPPILQQTTQKLSPPSKLSKWKGASKQEVDTYQSASNISEKKARSKTFQTNNKLAWEQPKPTRALSDMKKKGPVLAEPFQARWLEGQLFLWRSVKHWDTQNITESKQGLWLNDSQLRSSMKQQIQDLLPNVELEPFHAFEEENSLALVSLPYLLTTNETITLPPLNEARLDSSLIVAWAGVLCAIIAGAILINGVMRLSERRASFVSAVTHELRTPLTTFQLYTEMLQKDILPPEKKQQYLQTLSRESDRLNHLVQNVLTFSQLEKGSARSNLQKGEALQLIKPILPRLQERLDTVGLKLQVRYDCPFEVSVDSSKLEHILFNLIDNASKYAVTSDPHEVRLDITTDGTTWQLSVRDFGPGISVKEREKIFNAFHKSAGKAAESSPGVGLGLALSKRLAQSMHGTLNFGEPPGGGACFTLELPLEAG